MSLIAVQAPLPGGLATLQNSHPPQTPFSALMESRSQGWIDSFLSGLASGAGFSVTPVSDGLTPPVAITGTADVPAPASPAALAGNPLVAGAVLAVVGFLIYKALK